MKRMVERARLRPHVRVLRAVIVFGAVSATIAWGSRYPSRMMKCFSQSKPNVVRMTVMKLATEAYPQWRSVHREPCPSRLDELSEYMTSKDTKDPWGTPYLMRCDATHPIVVSSAGEDGIFGTADDVRSSD